MEPKTEKDFVKPSDVPKALVEAISIFELARKAGIPSEDLFIYFNNFPYIAMGTKELAVPTSVPYTDKRDPFLLWEQVTESWNALCQDPDFGWIKAFENSDARKNAVNIMAIFLTKGKIGGTPRPEKNPTDTRRA